MLLLATVNFIHAAEKKPNIVFMMADNLGYGELGCYGGGILRGAPTPRDAPTTTIGLPSQGLLRDRRYNWSP